MHHAFEMCLREGMAIEGFRLTELRAARVEFKGEVQQLIGIDESEAGGARWVPRMIHVLDGEVKLMRSAEDVEEGDEAEGESAAGGLNRSGEGGGGGEEGDEEEEGVIERIKLDKKRLCGVQGVKQRYGRENVVNLLVKYVLSTHHPQIGTGPPPATDQQRTTSSYRYVLLNKS